MTPDKEFPSEVLKLLYHMIGELCVRGRSLNLAALVIRDTTEIFTEQMELYRRVCKRCCRSSPLRMAPAVPELTPSLLLRRGVSWHTLPPRPLAHRRASLLPRAHPRSCVRLPPASRKTRSRG